MAKKDKKKGKKEAKPADAVGAVRTAVERTFQATADSAQSTRTRAQDLVDEVAGAAGRVREMIEDIRVLEDLKGLRTEVDALQRRVAELESGAPAKGASRGSARKPAGRAAASAKKPRSSGAKPRSSAATTRSSAAKPRSSAATTRSSGAKPRSSAATTRSSGAKPRSSAATTRKPGSSAPRKRAS